MASGNRFLAPPMLGDEVDFDSWVHEVEVWQCVTTLEKKKQGPALYLSLEGKARKGCFDLGVDVLNKDDGVDKLIEKLKSLYAKDKDQAAFLAYKNFETFIRPPTMSIQEYIHEFERLNNKLKAYKMDLPGGVLAYQLLKNARISEEKQQLARATIGDLTFENMSKQLKAIHDHSDDKGTDLPIKVEPTFETESYEEQHAMYVNRGKWNRGFGRSRRGRYSTKSFQGAVAKNGRKLNPLDSAGNPTKCAVCQSIFHWAKDCPDSYENSKEEINVTLFTNEVHDSYIETFVGEILGLAVLDSGCTQSVCGKGWLQCYIDMLSPDEVANISEYPSSTHFRFGDGKVVQAKKRVRIPASIAGVAVEIDVDVVECELPLLLSKSSMKKAQTHIDFVNDKAHMFGNEIDLKYTSSGHYCISINSGKDVAWNERSVLINMTDLQDKSWQEKERMATKLHKQFGHPRSTKLKELLIEANVKDEDLISMIEKSEENCDVCLKYKNPKLRPVVGLSMSKSFNDCIAMDLKQVGKSQVLHMIDLATRYSAASVVRSKDKDVIVHAVFKHWVALFGVPKKILTDNGGEFNNDLMRDMAEQLNTIITTTAAESPWSNGIVERHNAVIGSMIQKIQADTSCSVDIALAWALSAKNALHNAHGFSPNQLVFGQNPNLPSVLIDKPPALEGCTNSEVIAVHLNAMHVARKAFLESESSEKVRRALRHKTRDVPAMVYQTGDVVYYKRHNSRCWKGPGIVIGHDNKQVFVRHGGIYVRVSPCSLMHINEHNHCLDDAATPEMAKQLKEKRGHQESVGDKPDVNKRNDMQVKELYEEIIQDETAEPERVPTDAGVDESLNQDVHDDHVHEDMHDIVSTSETSSISDNENDRNPTISHGILPKLRSTVFYHDPDSKSWREANVLSRAGKASGKNNAWFNLQNLDDNSFISVNFEVIEGWRNVDKEVLQNSAIEESFDVVEAKMMEFKNWQTHNVYEEVPDNGQNCISVKWVITKKIKNGESVTKARLVARGFEEYNLDEIRKDSPTCSKENLRLILAVISSLHWKINSLDVRAAFLQGNEIDRDVYLRPPREAATSAIWKLKRTVYGLCDAPRAWYLRVKEFLCKQGVIKSKFDDALFFWVHDGVLHGIMCCHVDDFCWGGTNVFVERIIVKLKTEFQISHEETETFKYLGLTIKQDKSCITLHQHEYIKDLKLVEVSGERRANKKDQLISEEITQLKMLAGQLNWIASQTRPDMCYAACAVSTSVKECTVEDICQANKCIRDAKIVEVSLQFSALQDLSKVKLISFSDASFANLRGGGSQGGFLVFLQGCNDKYALISWQSKKLKRVVKSTIAAETLALQDAAESCFMLRSQICELLQFDERSAIIPIVCIIDNKSLYDAIHSTKTVTEKRLKVDICLLRDMLSKNEIEIVWKPTKLQLADGLTKTGASKGKLLEALSFEGTLL